MFGGTPLGTDQAVCAFVVSGTPMIDRLLSARCYGNLSNDQDSHMTLSACVLRVNIPTNIVYDKFNVLERTMTCVMLLGIVLRVNRCS